MMMHWLSYPIAQQYIAFGAIIANVITLHSILQHLFCLLHSHDDALVELSHRTIHIYNKNNTMTLAILLLLCDRSEPYSSSN
jgi:hypothetical protein